MRARAALEQSWVALDTALINDDSGESDALALDLAYYHGRDSDGSWSEGSPAGSEVFGGVRRGRYVLRVEPEFGRDALGALPETVHVEVIRGAFLWAPFFIVALALLVYPIFVGLRSLGFERRRWENSDHPMVRSS